MEYVHGKDLRELLAACAREAREVPFAVALSIVAAAAAGLDHAHRRCAPDGRPLHLVHRDVSLSNIMVGFAGEVKVVDFGIARANVSSHHTQPGIVRGKASYMSPEQCLARPVDLRADVFALGIVLYELTTGRRCFLGDTDFDRMVAAVRGVYIPPTVHTPTFPRELEAVIVKALAVEPGNRYASAAAMIEALEHVARQYSWQLGAAPVAAFVGELFDEEVVAVIEDQVVAEVVADELAATSIEPTTRSLKPRFGRGTIAEAAARGEAGDDEPTRGWRSLQRRASAAPLAA
jgi:serine/threonine protein kinase